MTLGDGTPRQKALFALLVAVPLIGLVLSASDKLERIGGPNVGWMMDERYVSPTRRSSSEAGLRGGGRAMRINGQPLPEDLRFRGPPPLVRTEMGATNTLTLVTPRGTERELTFAVEPWTWHDFIFTEGGTDVIGLLFAIVGIAAFALRPYEAPSWALLSIGAVAGGTLMNSLTPLGEQHFWTTLYFLTVVSFVSYSPLHLALALPVEHPWLRRPGTVWAIYGLCLLQATFNYVGWSNDYKGIFENVRAVGLAALLVSIVVFIARCLWLARSATDRLVAQRARILLGGALIGLAPFGIVQFTREAFGVFPFDSRFSIWSLGVFAVALGRVTVRQELLNARIAVRRAVIYAVTVGVLTILALVLIAMRPYAVAVLLFPLLYLWPWFDARLNHRLYPQRARFPELLRGVGNEMAACATVDDVLDVLVQAPTRLCDARGSVAFVFAGNGGGDERVRSTQPLRHASRPLDEEPLVQMMRATRQEIMRSRIGLQPHYVNIKSECVAGFERLGATLLLPIVHEQNVIGGLAVGPRASGDLYEGAEIDALSTAAQLAVQALMRVEATERLREREREFTELNRFFPPQIIDQVLARGGASKLRSQRKVVTVVFADLRGFTSFSDSVEPEEVMATLEEYHVLMGKRIAEFAGTLERFAGDGFMVFFNDPVDQPDHAERAARMVLAMYADLERLRATWRRKGYQIDVGTGIHTGYATCGFIGYEGRRDYAVIGNVSNLASRLSAAAAAGEILVSSRVYGELGEVYQIQPVGEMSLKGFHQPQMVYRLVGAAQPGLTAIV